MTKRSLTKRGRPTRLERELQAEVIRLRQDVANLHQQSMALREAQRRELEKVRSEKGGADMARLVSMWGQSWEALAKALMAVSHQL